MLDVFSELYAQHDSFSLTIYILRATGLIIALIVLLKSARSAWAFTSDARPANLIHAAAFSCAAYCASFQSGYVLEGFVDTPPSGRLVLSLVLMNIAMVSLHVLISVIPNVLIVKFFSLTAYADNAIAIAQLSAVDPEKADEIADQCRAELAKSIVKSGDSNV